MAHSPLAISTLGFLNSPLSVSTVGFLTISVEDAIQHGSGITVTGNRILWQLQRDDEELLAIIAAFMEVMDE
jgi:hypothetical protein